KECVQLNNDLNFLELAVRQTEHVDTTVRVYISPHRLMYLNAHEHTRRIVKYANQQSCKLRCANAVDTLEVSKESFPSYPRRADDDWKHWYAPGHIDVYNVLYQSSVL
ncbi:hypothetical protein EV121DRAFT_161056, partial [Schizophyllum commune]